MLLTKTRSIDKDSTRWIFEIDDYEMVTSPINSFFLVDKCFPGKKDIPNILYALADVAKAIEEDQRRKANNLAKENND